MARWSRNMSAKSWRSRLGVGEGGARGAGLSSCGSDDCGLCAAASIDAAAIKRQSAASLNFLSTVETLLYILPSRRGPLYGREDEGRITLAAWCVTFELL